MTMKTRAATNIHVGVTERDGLWHVLLKRSGNEWYVSKGYKSLKTAETRARNFARAALRCRFVLDLNVKPIA